MSFWPTQDHWSVQIPLHSPHRRMPVLDETGVVALADFDGDIPPDEYLSLEYMDWKSGGDTNFAPIATADGELDCRGFWNKGNERRTRTRSSPATRRSCPTHQAYVENVGANFGRVRTIKLEPQDHATAIRNFHRDDNNRFNPDDEGWVVRSWLELTDNPDSYMLLMESGPDGLPDPATEIRVPLHRGLAVRRRHAAALARRRPQRRRAPVRADQLLRERPGARAVGRRQPPGTRHPLTDKPGVAHGAELAPPQSVMTWRWSTGVP